MDQLLVALAGAIVRDVSDDGTADVGRPILAGVDPRATAERIGTDRAVDTP
jgi:hypothetical protein